mmetsp:Transcript_8026/g.17387  ORF Transcript_8026/g.17387 Transcript_8026/m.17387 type:complete len:347 (+) Transcript_8026:458-1498(+)
MPAFAAMVIFSPTPVCLTLDSRARFSGLSPLLEPGCPVRPVPPRLRGRLASLLLAPLWTTAASGAPRQATSSGVLIAVLIPAAFTPSAVVAPCGTRTCILRVVSPAFSPAGVRGSRLGSPAFGSLAHIIAEAFTAEDPVLAALFALGSLEVRGGLQAPLRGSLPLVLRALGLDLVLQLAEPRGDLLLGTLQCHQKRRSVPHVERWREEGVDVGLTVCPFEYPVEVELQGHGEIKVDQHPSLAEVKVSACGHLAGHDQDGHFTLLEAREVTLPLHLGCVEVEGLEGHFFERLSNEILNFFHVARVCHYHHLLLLDEVIELDQCLQTLKLLILVLDDFQMMLHSLQAG